MVQYCMCVFCKDVMVAVPAGISEINCTDFHLYSELAGTSLEFYAVEVNFQSPAFSLYKKKRHANPIFVL